MHVMHIHICVYIYIYIFIHIFVYNLGFASHNRYSCCRDELSRSDSVCIFPCERYWRINKIRQPFHSSKTNTVPAQSVFVCPRRRVPFARTVGLGLPARSGLDTRHGFIPLPGRACREHDGYLCTINGYDARRVAILNRVMRGKQASELKLVSLSLRVQ